jgi:5'-3' exonuclease
MEEIDELEQLSVKSTKSFASMAKKDEDIVMVVDALNLAFRYLHSGQLNFANDYLKTVQSLSQSYSAGKVIMACDKGSSSFRKAIHPEYKANRKEKYELQTPEEKEKFDRFFKDFEDTLILLADYYEVLRYENVEADDIAAYIVVHKRPNIKVWLISTDKDYDLLISTTVSRFSYITRKEITEESWPYDCSKENYLGLKCLQGDSGDNIKGVDGIGPKRATALLEQYDDIFSIIDLLPLPGKQKFIQNLNVSGSLLELNLKLMDLPTYCEEAIGTENIKDVLEKLSRLDII